MLRGCSTEEAQYLFLQDILYLNLKINFSHGAGQADSRGTERAACVRKMGCVGGGGDILDGFFCKSEE